MRSGDVERGPNEPTPDKVAEKQRKESNELQDKLLEHQRAEDKALKNRPRW